MNRIGAVVLALVLNVGTAAVSVANEPSFQHIEESLTCQCGCGLTVHSCNHLQCPSAIPLRQEVRQQMAESKGEDGILAHFAEKYGEKILSSPTTTGFNLAAWVMPFVVVGIGALVVGFTLLRWRRRTADTVIAPQPPSQDGPKTKSEHQKTFERELEDFDL